MIGKSLSKPRRSDQGAYNSYMSIFQNLFGVKCDQCGQKIKGQAYSLPGVLSSAGSHLCESCFQKAERSRQEEAQNQSEPKIRSAPPTPPTAKRTAPVIMVKLGHAREMACPTCNNQGKHDLAVMTREDGGQETLWKCSLCGAYHS